MNSFEANDGASQLSINGVRTLDASRMPVVDGKPYIAIIANAAEHEDFHARFALSLPTAKAFRDRLSQEIAEVEV